MSKEQIDAVVLAAGRSSRCSRYKLALSLGDKAVIERSIEGMYSLVQRIIVVVGFYQEAVRRLLAPYARVEFAPREDLGEDMFGSVRVGVARVRAGRFFLQPADIPLVGQAVYERLLATEADVAIPIYAGRKGHPLLLSSEIIPDILAAPPESTLRDVLAGRKAALVPVEDEGILLDIDTLEDYQKLLNRFRARTGGG
ncbi:MAG: nucleotidyltransferase family protein [Chloroflexi bacterium]|nr:nucleotidyltransferase family protein [Chloroflexota bacterium]